jgi:exodeoxyribonuclease VII small subunit
MTDHEPEHETVGEAGPAADPGPEALGYADALAELEEILHELEGEAVDVDHLGERVRRAAELIRLCRSRIDTARMEIEQVVAELDAGG